MLGETYECVREDLGFKFVAEKVSHHPAVMACHAHSDAFELYQDSQIKTKFWGKSMEFVPISVVHIKLGGCGDHYTYTKPSTLVRGIITGNRSVELQGEVDIINHTTGEVATISFKKGGFFGGVSTQVECRLYSAEPNGERTCVRTLWGDWTEKLYPEHDPYSPIWEANPPPADYKEYYGFDEFAMSLNEITPDIEP
ncbi:Oxysterol-binding protein 3, partial [Spiromyces aspiralis]